MLDLNITATRQRLRDLIRRERGEREYVQTFLCIIHLDRSAALTPLAILDINHDYQHRN